MRITTILPLAAALALAACSGGAEDEAADGSAGEDMAEAMADAPQPRPGQYRTTMEMLEVSIPDAPPEMAQMMQQAFSQGGEQGNTYCVTPEQANQSREDMVKNMADSDCTVDRFEVAGGQIDAALTCPGDGNVTGQVTMKGAMTEDGADMEMGFKAQIPQAGEATIRMRVVSERIGDCA